MKKSGLENFTEPRNLVHCLGGHLIDAHFLVAVSGGADSMVLLHLMNKSGLPVSAAHVNYKLRDDESDRDQQLVEAYCKQNEITLHLLNAGKKMKEKSGNVQQHARSIRYDFFQSLQKKYNYTHLLTAHHADDLAESFFMFAIRGAGSKALSSMLQENSLIIRPFLQYSSSEIKAFAVKNKIPYCEDSSNSEEKYMRNFFRHRIFSSIAEKQPDYLKGLMHTLHALRTSSAIEEQWFNDCLERFTFKDEISSGFRLAAFAEYCKSNSYLITGFLHHLGFNASQSEEIQTALKNKISGKSWVLKGRKALLYKGNLLSEQDQHPFVSVIWQSAQEPLLLGNYQLRVLSTIKTSNEQEKSWLVSLDVKKVSFPLEIRPWKKGDYFYPEKGKGKVLLSDFFSNLGIDQFTRSKLPLLCKENQILSVPFFRNDARALATKDVRQKLHIQIKKI